MGNKDIMDEKFVAKYYIAALSCVLRPVVLSPDVKHEDTGDEEEGHDQDWDGTNFDSGRVVGVEPPHSAGGSAAGPGGGPAAGGRGLGAAAAGAAPLPDRRTAAGARAPRAHRRRTGCWSGHIGYQMKSKN